jgi:hypothetical protein
MNPKIILEETSAKNSKLNIWKPTDLTWCIRNAFHQISQPSPSPNIQQQSNVVVLWVPETTPFTFNLSSVNSEANNFMFLEQSNANILNHVVNEMRGRQIFLLAVGATNVVGSGQIMKSKILRKSGVRSIFIETVSRVRTAAELQDYFDVVDWLSETADDLSGRDAIFRRMDGALDPLLFLLHRHGWSYTANAPITETVEQDVFMGDAGVAVKSYSPTKVFRHQEQYSETQPLNLS